MTSWELTGLLGWAERVITALGEWGVGLLVLLETVFPPLPSEVILPLAGFLTSQGAINLPLVVVTATGGAWLGALLLYGLGARLGLERSITVLAKLPLVDRDDFERAAGWFDRHGRASIFFGRLIPGVRSLISLPAGAARMPLVTFTAFTLAGSGLWNAPADRRRRRARRQLRHGRALRRPAELPRLRRDRRAGGVARRPQRLRRGAQPRGSARRKDDQDPVARGEPLPGVDP